jgi:hypothetical protein
VSFLREVHPYVDPEAHGAGLMFRHNLVTAKLAGIGTVSVALCARARPVPVK